MIQLQKTPVLKLSYRKLKVEKMRVVLSSDQSKFFDVNTKLDELSIKNRLARAAKIFFLLFIIAVVSVFIPILHFLLVPLFLVLSFFMAFKAYQARYKLNLKTQRLCFNCNKPLSEYFLLTEDLKFKCDGCGSRYIVFVADAR